METALAFPVRRIAQSRRSRIDFGNLAFGKEPTDHLFISEFADGQWQNSRIEPFHDLRLSPFALALHYGQTVFEGMKAFRMDDGSIAIFRPEKHYERLLRSLDRMCMPEVSYDMFLQSLHELVDLERDWVPDQPDSALYLRPFMFASEARLGVKVSDEYIFMTVATPVTQYYAKPLRVKVELEFVRATEGGAGFAKCGGNYGVAFYPTQKARSEGFDQVLWTDSYHHEFIEESGTMNVMFVIDGALVTPPLTSTILDGVTRDSLLTLARHRGMNVEERFISVHEIKAALRAGKRVEAFGAGTAAVVAPIEWIQIGDAGYQTYTGDDAVMFSLKHELDAIRAGRQPDIFGWNYIVDRGI
jgi:branched-chain amino acid aminotransferase